MKAIFGFFRKGWVLTLLGLLALSLVIWVVGPLFAVVSLLALVTGIVLPFLEVIVSFDPGVVDAVFIALMIGLQVLSGVIVVVLVPAL